MIGNADAEAAVGPNLAGMQVWVAMCFDQHAIAPVPHNPAVLQPTRAIPHDDHADSVTLTHRCSHDHWVTVRNNGQIDRAVAIQVAAIDLAGAILVEA